jgi:transcriptional regulator with XRE-family HTH domain
MQKSVRSREHRRFLVLMVKARKRAGLTQARLAALLGRPQSFVAKYEGGERRLDVIEFLTIARKLNVDPREIITNLNSG